MKKTELIDTENRLMVPRGGVGGLGGTKWVKGVKRDRLPAIK